MGLRDPAPVPRGGRARRDPAPVPRGGRSCRDRSCPTPARWSSSSRPVLPSGPVVEPVDTWLPDSGPVVEPVETRLLSPAVVDPVGPVLPDSGPVVELVETASTAAGAALLRAALDVDSGLQQASSWRTGFIPSTPPRCRRQSIAHSRAGQVFTFSGRAECFDRGEDGGASRRYVGPHFREGQASGSVSGKPWRGFSSCVRACRGRPNVSLVLAFRV